MNATAHLLDTNQVEVHTETISIDPGHPRYITWTGKLYRCTGVTHNKNADSDVYYCECPCEAL